MRLLPASLSFALLAATGCGPTTTTPPVADAATDGPPADQCRSADLAPLPPGCRVVNPDPCTGRGTVVCDDAGADVPTVDAADAAADVAADLCMIECPAPPPGCRYEGPVTCSPRSCGTLVCADAGADAAADAPADAAGDVPISCSGSGAASFPTFSSACGADGDCAVAVHQTDCCGNQRGLGIVASQRAAFEAAEAVCRPMYPRCGCPTRGILCDDEQWTFSADMVGVACRAGRCTTFVR